MPFGMTVAQLVTIAVKVGVPFAKEVFESYRALGGAPTTPEGQPVTTWDDVLVNIAAAKAEADEGASIADREIARAQADAEAAAASGGDDS